MNEAAANIPWLPASEALTRVAHHRGCTREAVQLLIVGAGKANRIKARGVIKGRSVSLQIVGAGKGDRLKAPGVIKGPHASWGFPISPNDVASDCEAPVSPLPTAWNGTIDLAGAAMKPPDVLYQIINLELCFIELITASLLPAPAEKARWSAGEAIAYWVKGVPFPWKEWQGAGALAGEIEQAEIVLGELIGADQVLAWGRLSPEGPMEPLPGSDLRIPGFRWRVSLNGDLGTSPPGRLAVFEGRRWYGIEVDSATVRQARPRPLTAQAEPIAPPPRPPDNASEIEHVVWAVRFLRITDPDKLAGLRGKKLQKRICNTVGPTFWCGQRTVQRGKKRADSM